MLNEKVRPLYCQVAVVHCVRTCCYWDVGYVMSDVLSPERKHLRIAIRFLYNGILHCCRYETDRRQRLTVLSSTRLT